ncbi:hypothetical protein QFZ42_003337 [Variovorax paradoxus]|uniref:hypothetical protein n=1 Tax=Variovorax paradoxus TaxID=34073 RepID=UPI0027951C40|nr:hypothetical protein [Variovorax paradoxus]MDQ0571503.1 hypothetical protein [Variovorax paradoxus]
MARIRTIKPEFFTSEDIVSLSPLTRLLYIAIWCEADKEGRLAWKPLTFKLRYFPGDACDIQAMCQEIVDSGLVVLYGEGYGVIPTFKAHQHINPRESESNLPEPVAITTRKARVTTRQPRDSDAQVGREGKGKEGDTRDESRDDLPVGFADFWKAWPITDRKQAKGKCLDAWKKASAERDAAGILAHVESLKLSASWTKNSGEFIPAPLVYLNQRRWEGAEEAATAAHQESFV